MNQQDDRARKLEQLVQDLGMLVAKHWLKQQREHANQRSSVAAEAPAPVNTQKPKRRI